MRLDARYGTAIGLLDQIVAGAPAERVLTSWARANRYAGSKDRAAVRDIVFSALRGLKCYQTIGDGHDGRAVVLGMLLARGMDPNTVFTGLTYAPDSLNSQEEAVVNSAPRDTASVFDVPDWTIAPLRRVLGPEFEATMLALVSRAPVDLRVNLAKATPDQATTSLSNDGIEVEATQLTKSGLRVLSGERGVARSNAYLGGHVELQDAGSQAVVEALPLDQVTTVLDYCAGGGGKSLALASLMRGRGQITAYDASSDRLKNLIERADRAGADIKIAKNDPARSARSYDMVLLDVPCSGSGAWRRNPDGKWKFGPDDLAALVKLQAEILAKTAPLVAMSGCLAYITCSLLAQENEDQILHFLAQNGGWHLDHQTRFPLGEQSDGFFIALMSKS